MSVSTTIRAAQPTDFDAIAAIYNESIQQGGITFDEAVFTADHIQQWVQAMTDREVLLVLEHQGDILGWAILKRYSDRPAYRFTVESSIYLTRNAIGQGYGHQLQTALINQAQTLGYHHIVAKIVASNQSSIRFHKQFGYESVGLQKEVGFSRGQWHDILILQRLLSRGNG